MSHQLKSDNKQILGTTPVSGSTSGGIVYIDVNGTFNEDTSNLFWDATNKRLGIGKTPGTTIDVNGVVNASVDGHTNSGVIIPSTLIIPVSLFVTDVSKTIFIADTTYQVTAVKSSWGVVSISGTLNVEKCTGTTVPGSGTALLQSNFDLTAAVNTVVTGTLTGTTASLQLAAGDRLTVKLGGTLTGLVGCCVSIYLKRI